jgi:hypothetical protein
MEHDEPKTGRTLPIRIDEVYTLAEFQKRTRMSRSAMRAARRRGLRVNQCGKRCYVVGADWATFLAKPNGTTTANIVAE